MLIFKSRPICNMLQTVITTLVLSSSVCSIILVYLKETFTGKIYYGNF